MAKINVTRKIKNAIKFVAPTGLYLKYYAKKHDDLYRQLMIDVEAPEEYLNNPAVKEDYFKCLQRYGLPVRYYKELRFFDITDKKQRDSFVGPGKLYATWYGVNSGPSRPKLDDKITYLKTFKDFINREWLEMKDVSFQDFKAFCQRNPKMIVKNPKGYGGRGTHVFKYDNQSDEELKATYNQYVESEVVIESYINQKGFMHDVNPSSVNGCRVCTMRFKDHVEIFQCYATMGNGDVCVDNAYEGGLFTPIDVETGEILRDPCDELWHAHPQHPVSGVAMKGRIIPYWDKVKETVLKAADLVPDILYISWDVTVSEEGNIYLIEGNSCGDGMWLREGGEWPVYARAFRDNGVMYKYKLAYNYILKFHIQELMSYLRSYDEVEG